MPKRRSPDCLKQACLLNIAKNMDKVWCKDYEENFGGQGFIMYTLGPFEYLDGDMIQGIINILTRTQKLRRIHLDLLITTRLKHLHLQLPHNIPMHPIIKLITVRCRQLLELTISLESYRRHSTGNSYWTSSSKHVGLLELVRSLPSILYLDFSESQCSDQVLAAVSVSCPNIKILKVRGCPITNVGLQSLVMPSDSEKCRRLITLDVTRTAVSCEGLAMVIDKLPNLQNLLHDDTGTPLWLLHKEDFCTGMNVPDDQKHKLQILKCHNFSPNTSEGNQIIMFEVFSKYCPFLSVVDLVNVPCDTALLHLRSLHLKDLSLAKDGDESLISFSEGIFPLLQKCGQTLEKLTLSDINYVDIGMIGLCCRHLQHLQIQYYDVMDVDIYFTDNEADAREHYVPQFSKLLSFDFGLLDRSTGNIGPALHAVLKYAIGLKSLSLQNLHAFTDNILQNVLKVNRLVNLETLSLTGCNEITGDAIKLLLFEDNLLTKLAMHNCRNVYRKHFEEMLKFVQQNKLDISVAWS